ncbi:hypothetical protein DVH24_003787 [Malus domestica]|uniref:Uncharacterized protein n=1 Tax=Malus domestica TaxID=3750 RepID=A0A498KBC4_MALDO|nr:hypothetical protein DVH24_003787 [Malus domestica]
MDTTFLTPIQELQPYRRAAKIKVRICRIWKPDIPGMDGKSMGLHCILVHNRVRNFFAIVFIIDDKSSVILNSIGHYKNKLIQISVRIFNDVKTY